MLLGNGPQNLLGAGDLLYRTAWATQSVAVNNPILYVTQLDTNLLEHLLAETESLEHGQWLIAPEPPDMSQEAVHMCNQFIATPLTHTTTTYPCLDLVLTSLNRSLRPLFSELEASIQSAAAAHPEDHFLKTYAGVLESSLTPMSMRFIEHHCYSEPFGSPNDFSLAHLDGFGSGHVQVNLTLQGQRTLTIFNGDGSIHNQVQLKRGSLWIGNPTSFIHGVHIEEGSELPSRSLNFRTGFSITLAASEILHKMKYFASPMEEESNYDDALRRRADFNELIAALPGMQHVFSDTKTCIEQCLRETVRNNVVACR